MSSAFSIVVLGAKGRMGQMVLQACAQRLQGQTSPAFQVTGAVESAGSPHLGKPAGVDGIDLLVTDQLESLLSPGTVIIDFTVPQATLEALKLARRRGAGMVIGTTGFSAQEKQLIVEASASIPIVMAPNMSAGVTLMFRVAEMIARVLGPDFDAEIVEAHHNQKKDAPSGTALGFAEALARGREANLSDLAVYGREGMPGPRPKGEIGIHAVRGGDIVGDHTVLFAGEGERIEIKHMAHSRRTFAQGALRAALFLQGKSSGLYDMFAVLGL